MHDKYPTYHLYHPCRNLVLYYNAQDWIQQLMIHDAIDDPDDNWVSSRAQCSDRQVTDPFSCSSWWPSSPKMIVGKDECLQLCGTVGACDIKSYIDVDIPDSMDDSLEDENCNGIFYRQDFVDNVYESNNGYYWYFKGTKWRCVTELPSGCLNGNYPDNIYTLTEDEMSTYSKCHIPTGQTCKW